MSPTRVAAGVLGAVVALAAVVAVAGPAAACEPEGTLAGRVSWVLPVERAREVARSTGRPLLIVSLNGNLDGHC